MEDVLGAKQKERPNSDHPNRMCLNVFNYINLQPNGMNIDKWLELFANAALSKASDWRSP